jgi:hypothetical protein
MIGHFPALTGNFAFPRPRGVQQKNELPTGGHAADEAGYAPDMRLNTARHCRGPNCKGIHVLPVRAPGPHRAASLPSRQQWSGGSPRDRDLRASRSADKGAQVTLQPANSQHLVVAPSAHVQERLMS